jgi:hydrogenase nickel incorporation protein HypB
MPTKTVHVKLDIRAEHLAAANEFRHQMARQGTLVVRLISSPGSGKTTLLEKTAAKLRGSHTIGVMVGDVETDRDARRLAPFASTVQITTGGACHLEIPLVTRALSKFDKSHFDILFIEDVGNLICPASHDLGEHLRVLLLSTTEGDDKPGKYPKAFRTSDVVVITKADLLPYVPFFVKHAEKDARRVHPALKFFTLSAQTDEGVEQWCSFLERELKRLKTAGNAENSDNGISHLTSPLASEKRSSRPAVRPRSTILKGRQEKPHGTGKSKR